MSEKKIHQKKSPVRIPPDIAQRLRDMVLSGVGVREASRLLGISEDAARKRSSRGKWLQNVRQDVARRRAESGIGVPTWRPSNEVTAGLEERLRMRAEAYREDFSRLGAGLVHRIARMLDALPPDAPLSAVDEILDRVRGLEPLDRATRRNLGIRDEEERPLVNIALLSQYRVDSES